jgi:hypothetical protein
MRCRLLSALLISACAVCSICPPQAQFRAFGASVDNRLNSDDLNAANAATIRLLDRPQLAEGGFEAWSNPRSGASGTIVAGKPLTRNGMDCRVLDYFIHVPGPRADRSRVLTWCKTKDGWKIG